MHKSAFFRLFPPPKFMQMKHVGLHISDDSIHFIEFDAGPGVPKIKKYGKADLPSKVVEDGDIMDPMRLEEILRDFDKKHDITYAKVAVPEEKAYLFHTEVPSTDVKTIAQNIEFKLEENVPLAAPDAVFYFDLLPQVEHEPHRASVSVVPKSYVEQLDSILKSAGIVPVAYEVLPKAVAKAAIPDTKDGAAMLVFLKKGKAGIYVLVGNVVSFSSTFSVSAGENGIDANSLSSEIVRIYTYWSSHSDIPADVSQIILAGKDSLAIESSIRKSLKDLNLKIDVANVWANVFDINKHVPSISRAESLDYAAAIGLAMD